MARENLEITLAPRSVLGKKLRQLRRDGFVPAHMYGQSAEALTLQGERLTIGRLVPKAGANIAITVTVEGAKGNDVCLIREVQRHPVSEEILHVDFMRVDISQKITAEVPLTLLGESPAAREQGGTVIQPTATLPVEALPLEMPEALSVSIDDLLEFGDVVLVSAIDVPEGAQILLEDDDVVARVLAPRIEAEPEVELAEGELAEGEEGELAEGEEGDGEADEGAGSAEAE